MFIIGQFKTFNILLAISKLIDSGFAQGLIDDFFGVVLDKSDIACIEEYKCFDPVCIPPDYDVKKPPPGLSKIVGNVNFESSQVLNIDIHQMTFTVNAKVVVIWHDPRLKFCNQTKTKPLDTKLFKSIWTPEIEAKKFATEFKIQGKSK